MGSSVHGGITGCREAECKSSSGGKNEREQEQKREKERETFLMGAAGFGDGERALIPVKAVWKPLWLCHRPISYHTSLT